MFKVIIAGSRHYSDYNHLRSTCDRLLRNVVDPIEIVSGGANGADTLGERYASERDLHCTRFAADWKSLGKSAGPARNIQMGDYADALIAFPLGKSKGTLHMMQYARARGLPVKCITSKS